jgi:hypothetical protein
MRVVITIEEEWEDGRPSEVRRTGIRFLKGTEPPFPARAVERAILLGPLSSRSTVYQDWDTLPKKVKR